MAEELKLYYQNEARLREECRDYNNKDDLIRNVFVKALKIGKEIGFTEGYNKAFSQKSEIDNEIFDDYLEDEEPTSTPESFDALDELFI